MSASLSGRPQFTQSSTMPTPAPGLEPGASPGPSLSMLERLREAPASALEIPWTLRTGVHEWKYIDKKVVGSNTDLSPNTAYHGRPALSWTEILASWACKEAIQEAGHKVTQIQRERPDGQSTRLDACFCFEQPLTFAQVRQLVERTVEMRRETEPRRSPKSIPHALRLPPGTISWNERQEALQVALSVETLTECRLQRITECMKNLEYSAQWCSNPKMYFILNKSNCLRMFPGLLKMGLSDLWLPLHRRLLRKVSEDHAEMKSFIHWQEVCSDEDASVELRGQHLTLDSVDTLDLVRLRYLGSGGFGEVHSVRDRRSGRSYACKTMHRPVRFESHVALMDNFKREITGMRRVQHQHCVDLVASCTDMDTVTIFSSPVADMDLATFLNSDIDRPHDVIWPGPGKPLWKPLLYKSIGCITSALVYLHSLGIRHDDLKPNNILLHGTNLLLTDFGFCLDSTDSGMTTTTGPPTHSTRRYSAPEIFDAKPRSRLTDVWSLGCVLVDIVSRILGFKLDKVRSFWLSRGSKIDSYADNPTATSAWLSVLLVVMYQPEGFMDMRLQNLIALLQHAILEPERLLRPTASQVFKRLTMSGGAAWIDRCCWTAPESPQPHDHGEDCFQWIAIGDGNPEFGPEVIFLDLNLDVLACQRQHRWMTTNSKSISQAAARLFERSKIIVAHAKDDLSQVPFAEFVKSWHIMCLRSIDYETVRIQAVEEGASSFLVQLQLLTLQLERRPFHGAPFVALVVGTGEHYHERFGPIRPLEAKDVSTATGMWQGYIKPYWPRSPSMSWQHFEYDALSRVAIAEARKLGIMLAPLPLKDD